MKYNYQERVLQKSISSNTISQEKNKQKSDNYKLLSRLNTQLSSKKYNLLTQKYQKSIKIHYKSNDVSFEDEQSKKSETARQIDFSEQETNYKSSAKVNKQILLDYTTIKPYIESTKSSLHQNSEKYKPFFNLKVINQVQDYNCKSIQTLNKIKNKRQLYIQSIIDKYTIKTHNRSKSQSPSENKRIGKQSVKNATKKLDISKLTQKQIEQQVSIDRYKVVKLIYRLVTKWSLDSFEVLVLVGKGQFADVYLAQEKQTKMMVALKVMQKQKIQEGGLGEQIVQEIKIQSFCQHPNILQLYGVFNDSNNIYMVLEYLEQGSLYDEMHMRFNMIIPEEEAADIIFQISLAIQYLHQNSIMHRDIKPENILIQNGRYKLCDFGVSSYLKVGMRKTFCGTFDYVSPEIFMGIEYGYPVDLWALGVLSYEICAGRVPFQTCIKQNQRIKINYDFPYHFSINLKNFISRLLIEDPLKRMTIQELLQHPWIVNKKGDEI